MRLIIISNRLPVTAVASGDTFTFKQSIGGLATGLNAYLRSFTAAGSEYLWVGWPGATIKANDEANVSEQLQRFNCHPIFITETMMEKFNEGFCNKTLWPNFHYFTSYYSYEEEQWATYKKVNELFCEKIKDILKPGDTVWIHDYHLLLLPQLLRDKIADLTIGFFLHIPFPSYEIFQILPKKCRNEILQGMLGADLIGFHTCEYSQHFKKSVRRLLGYEPHMDYFNTQKRLIHINTYPMGVDYHHIQKIAQATTASTKQQLLGVNQEIKTILSIDRLDYTKGIPNRLLSYEKFLQENPKWHRKVVLVLLVAPSREGVSHYRKMKKYIDELAGCINGKFGDIKWMPIIYQYRSFTQEQLTELYAISDVALVTPLRDGMNLIAKEYVSSRIDGKGVLILSEAAGAAKELVDAIIINPNCTEEIAAAIKQALEMPEDEQESRIAMMQSQLESSDVTRWGSNIINELQLIKNKQTALTGDFSKPENIVQHMKEHKVSGKKLLLLDYDGTLTPYVADPKQAIPSSELLTILSSIAADENSRVVIVSGRDRETLEQWLGDLNIDLVAEHGVWIRENNAWRLSKHLLKTWEPHVINIFEKFVGKLPGTFIERKDFSIAWHYRNADAEEGKQLAKELANHLLRLSARGDVRILFGNKVVEAMCSGIGKDIAARQFVERENYSVILAMGDDVTDEDMFRVLPEKAFTVKIGSEVTSARFRVPEQSDALRILSNFIP
ncbi:MAG TPA: bifunctional alpha,alpha-trehalose-phosphate synthase (UDP-forming)/trehalose-phosphatase [Gammaproteobacteria bacterium]|nr:bifunctional alpha,alpha-trehalose-phosphate synthase (UDP-forming)/trehalose-phosphatase [Gammaproteobacteria bacterium]